MHKKREYATAILFDALVLAIFICGFKWKIIHALIAALLCSYLLACPFLIIKDMEKRDE